MNTKREFFSTRVTKEEIGNGISDSYGALYSKDGSRLLKCKNKGIKEYTVRSGTKVICDKAFRGCTGLAEVTIPESVTSIGSHAFASCTELTDITIPSSVTSIRSHAFEGCTGLTSVAIPNSVRSIGCEALSGCSGLKRVTIGDGVTTIGRSAFELCTGLIRVTIGNGVTTIDERAFFQCHNLIQVTIPNSVTEINYAAFSGCTGLTSVNIGNSVTEIGAFAFRGCTGFTELTIGEGVTSIGDGAFEGCTNLTKVNYNAIDASKANPTLDPEWLTDYRTFKDCPKLSEVIIGNKVAVIPSYLFYECTGLTNLTIGNRVTEIGRNAFYKCSSLTKVNIPQSVTEIGSTAFSKCIGLTTLILEDGEDTLVMTANGSYSSFYNCPIETLYLGRNVSCRGCNIYYDYPFGNNTSLISLTISESVTEIPPYAFYRCTGLAGELVIHSGVTTIGDRAFYGCTGLTALTLEDGEETLTMKSSSSYTPFTGCPIETLYLGRDVNYSSSYSPFRNNASLTSLTISNNVTSIGDWAFSNCTGLTVVNFNAIPCNDTGSSNSLVYSAFYGCTNISTVNIGEEVTIIPSSLCYNCSKLTKVTIPSSVTEISRLAFSGCTGLTKFEVAEDNEYYCAVDGVLFTKDMTTLIQFPAASSMTSYNVPNSVTKIGAFAFDTCRGLTSITIPNSVTSIGSGAFRDCSGLTSITIPNSVTEISRLAFSGCTSLTEVSIPNSVTTIGEFAYEGCMGLTSVTIPESVTSIGSGAFESCTGLESVTIPNSITMGMGLFYGCNPKLIEGLLKTLPSINIEVKERAYDYEENEDECYFDDLDNRHFGKYAGTYAQDEAGWSDEDIDDVFEGYADAYWNID